MSKPPPRHQWRSWAAITFVLSLVTAVGAGLLLVPKMHTAHLLAQRGVVTDAEVVGFRAAAESHDDTWTLEFTTATGERVRARTKAVTRDEAVRHPVGTRLPVRYDPRHPTRVWSVATPLEPSFWWGSTAGSSAPPPSSPP
ncbi:DUF3592 domain-containing protein [Kineococcus radiotolerans]|uniref:DUF3592 domain-containing protein n=1 Tax=Kineococcus radiotolerans (strain ATCC BAA-149 / DSM 14245 / SRS30216) TaxID=266940 RepID=A6W554_KINRD|nr:DUF3592 domain-containing protein [Kineococcus radiotolerans]ABS01943.1 hypothetical protein Krad_0453 [Kineococcus radiotolerans SRS30216 = ATCC BAA-149]